MLKLIFLALEFRLHLVKKREKKSKKEKSAFCKKNFFSFACSQVGHSSGGQYGSKKSCGKGVIDKKFFFWQVPWYFKLKCDEKCFADK